MGLPRRYLREGEQLVAEVAPHWSFFWRAGAHLALALGVAAATWSLTSHDVAVLAAVAVLVLVAVELVGRYLRWRSTSLVLTTNRLVARSGLLATRGVEVPLARVDDVRCEQSFLGRIAGVGDLVVTSGGRRDGPAERRFRHVPAPREVQGRIVEQLEAHGGGLSVAEQLERLDGLRQRGVLTDDEFADEKARLLDRGV